MNTEQINRVLEIGIALTSEKDIHVLLNKILADVMEVANCDAGTLYLKDGNQLKFTIMRNNTLHTYYGVHGETIDIPPVPIDQEHVSSLALLEDRTIRIDDVYDESLSDVLRGPGQYDSITGYHTTSVLTVPMKNPNGDKIGVLQLINAMENHQICTFSEDTIKVVESIASQAAVAIQNVRYMKEIKDLFSSFVETSIQAMGKLTPYNENHTRNMVLYEKRFLEYLNHKAMLEGKEIPYPPQKFEEMLMSCWLHDLGKLVTPVEIMNKNTRLWPVQKEQILHRMEIFDLESEILFLKKMIREEEYTELLNRTREIRAFIERADTNIISDRKEKLDQYSEWLFQKEDGTKVPYLNADEIHQLSVPYRTLTDEEFEIMHDHVVHTDALLAQLKFPSDMPHVRAWASSHHELLNGKGYPNHLREDEIPEEVRILTIMDIFEALTASDREYKKPKTPEEAIAHLHKIAGFNEVDERLVTLFEESRCWVDENQR